MKNNYKIFGFFVSGPPLNSDDGLEEEIKAQQKSLLFRNYIWGNEGMEDLLDDFDYRNYGLDVELILLQFYLNPNKYQLDYIKKIEKYRKKEKSVAISFIVTDENFFNKDQRERVNFLVNSIIQDLSKLEAYLSQEKLDTRISMLIKELNQAFEDNRR